MAIHNRYFLMRSNSHEIGGGVAIMLLGLLVLMGLASPVFADEFANNPKAPAKLNQTAAMRLSENAIGKQVGDYALIDRNGRQVSFSSFLGKPVLVSFIYTTCSEICPATTQHLANAVKQMQGALGDDSFIVLSVGFNAPWDSPQAMDEFARRQRIEMKNWEFLSADAATMKNLIRDMGFSYAYSVSGFDHITQLTIIDQQGKIYGQVYGDNFDLPFLAEPLSNLVGKEVQPRYSKLESLGNQIRLFCSIYDPKTNTYRVDYLFFINLFVSLAVIFYMWKLIYREVRRVWPYGKQPPPASSS